MKIFKEGSCCKMVFGKSKGNKQENKIYRILKKIDTNTKKSLGSGNSKDEKGDIMFKNYLIEIKHYKQVTDGLLNKWWRKIAKEARSENRIPILIYKENRRNEVVVMRMKFKGIPMLISISFNNWLKIWR